MNRIIKHPIPHSSGLSFEKEVVAKDLWCRHCGLQFQKNGKGIKDVLDFACHKSPDDGMHPAGPTEPQNASGNDIR